MSDASSKPRQDGRTSRAGLDVEGAAQARRRIDWMAAQARGHRVLDLGCGGGALSLLLAREGFSVVGADADAALVASARERLRGEASTVAARTVFLHGDIASMAFDGSFDTIMAGGVLDGVEHPARLLADLYRRLSERGRIVLTTPFGGAPRPERTHPLRLGALVPMLEEFYQLEHVSIDDGHVRFVGLACSNEPGARARYDVTTLLSVVETAAIDAQRRYDERLAESPPADRAHPPERGEAAVPGEAGGPGAPIAELKAAVAARASARLETRIANIRHKDALERVSMLEMRARSDAGSDPIEREADADGAFTAAFKDLPRTVAGTEPLPRVAYILDEFSEANLVFDIDPVRLATDWQSALEARPPSYCLVETAWSGNAGAWSDVIRDKSRKIDQRLAAVLSFCRSRKIPTVFWNKEDPVHYDRFINTGAKFDHLFTTDASCLDRYRNDLSRTERLGVLAFAAQPKLHNPIRTLARDDVVCFAGTYHKQRYANRQAAIEDLLAPALARNLVIYDRTFGRREYSADHYGFPEKYQSAVRGSLDYVQMVEAYRAHRVFLNVNATSDSETMFSRRVFELLACGTPVISAYAKGIEAMLGDAVLFSGSAEETSAHLDALADDDCWMRRSVKGIRAVMSCHLAAHRLAEVETAIGRPRASRSQVTFLVVARWRTLDHLAALERMLKSQRHRAFRVVLAGRVPPAEWRTRIAAASGSRALAWLDAADAAQCATFVQAVRRLDVWVAFMDARNAYGPHYLTDYAQAAGYYAGHLIGRSSHLIEAADGTLSVGSPGHEHVVCRSVHPHTIAAKGAVFALDLLHAGLGDRWYKHAHEALALHRFGFVDRRAVGGLDWSSQITSVLEV